MRRVVFSEQAPVTSDRGVRAGGHVPLRAPPVALPHPVRLAEVELSGPLPTISAVGAADGRRYRRALVLVRLHTQPLGQIDIRLDDGGAPATALAEQIWQALRSEIIEHLRRDGVAEVTGLGPAGLPNASTPLCVLDRERLLADAPTVSVIVATRGRPALLTACLRSLAAQVYPRYEVLVVDNAQSCPETEAIVQEMAADGPLMRYLREAVPGMARAQNRALREATGELIAFTDDDAVADRHWLEALAHAFRMAENVGCVTGLVWPLELETAPQTWFEQSGGFSRGFVPRIFDLASHRPEDDTLFPYSAGKFGTGANMAFDASILRGMGGFDEVLGPGTPTLGGSDLAAFLEVIYRGHQLVYTPAALVRHLHRRDYAALRTQMYAYGAGFSAFLTRSVIHHPTILPDLLTKLPRGAVRLLNPNGPKHGRKEHEFPLALTLSELQGMASGPLRYAQVAWSTRSSERRTGHLQSPSGGRTPAR